MNPPHYATYNVRGPPPLRTWMPPSPQELQFYDNLFAQVDEQRRNVIGGQQAVAFFTRSHLDKLILREIWNIADSERRSELSRNEFYVAMRLISMAQRGEQVTVQRFYQLAAIPYPLPMMEGVAGMQQAGHGQQQPGTQFQTQNQAPVQQQDFGGSHPQSSGAAYALTVDEKSKYDAVFQQYDTDRDGFLLGAEAVALFQLSGLDRNVLRDIWTMADVTQDSKLNIQEFYAAMHLIVCLSKRGLPMPPALPRELRETAFGATRAGASTPGHGFGSQVAETSLSSNGLVEQQHENVPPPEPEGMSAFDSLAMTEDAPLPSLVSATTRSSRTNSFNQPDATTKSSQLGNTNESAVPPATDNFFGGFPSPATATPRTPSFQSKDRSNSASSMNSFSSFTGLAPLPPQQPAQPLPPQISGNNERIQKQVDNLAYSSLVGDSFGVSKPPVPSCEMLFMSSEEEKRLVGQLDEQNHEIAQSIANLKRKQSTIETISDTLRCLDELRHKLVTLSMKRESLRATARSSGENSTNEQSRHFVERNLRTLVENQKLLIQQLEQDVARYEGELEEAILSAKLQLQVSLKPRSPLIDAVSPLLTTHDSLDATSTRTLDFNGSSPDLGTITTPVAADTSGFNASSNVAVAPRSVTSAVTSSSADVGVFPTESPFSPAQDTSKTNSFDVFGDFAAPPSIDVSVSLLPDVDSTPEKLPVLSTPSPAAGSCSTGIDDFSAKSPLAAEDTAPPSTGTDTISPFSPFSPSPSPAAAGLPDFGDFNAAPSSCTAGNNTEPISFDTVALSASSTPAHESSLFSPTPASVATEIPAFDAFETTPVFTNDATESTSAAVATDNLIFSPVAADKSEANSFGDFGELSAENAVESSEAASKQGSTTNLLFSPTPSSTVEPKAASFKTFDDFTPDSSDNIVSVSASEEAIGSSAFASESNDFLGFGDFNATAASADSRTPSFASEKQAEAFDDSPFSIVAKDDTEPVCADFNATPDTVATPSEAVETTETSLLPLAAAESSKTTSDDIGDFDSAPVPTDSSAKKATEASGTSPFDSEFELIDDFKAAPTEATNVQATEVKESSEKSNEGNAFGDFHAASASTSDSFGDFGSFD